MGGSYLLPPPFRHCSLSKTIDVQLKTATKKSPWKSLRERRCNEWIKEQRVEGIWYQNYVCVGYFGSRFLCLSQVEACVSLGSCRLIPNSSDSQWESKGKVLLIKFHRFFPNMLLFNSPQQGPDVWSYSLCIFYGCTEGYSHYLAIHCSVTILLLIMRIPYNTLQILFSSSDCLAGPYTGAMPGKGPYLRPLGCPVPVNGALRHTPMDSPLTGGG